MPSELTQNVKAAIHNFVSLQTSNGEVAIDVLRSIRDEAALLMERQTIWDTFDADPFKFYDDDPQLRNQVERLKQLMSVISCSRISTQDGYSAIEAVVKCSKDSHTKNLEDSFRLTFHFQREKIYKDISKNENTALGIKHKSPTRITYDIYFSKDHGEKKKLLGVEVFAEDDFPSIEKAEPMESDFIDEDEMEGEIEGDKVEEMSVTSSSKHGSNRDRYCAYADPEDIEDFLTTSGLDLNAENALFFLMTFPYYEHEWDIFGFLLDCVFGDDAYEDISDEDEE